MPVDGILQGPGEHQLTPLVRGGGEAEVLGAQRRSSLEVVVGQVVLEQPVRHAC